MTTQNDINISNNMNDMNDMNRANTSTATPTQQAAPPQGALAGIRVIDLSRILGGPYCGQILGDHGADVLKVEPPQGDDTRTWGPPF